MSDAFSQFCWLYEGLKTLPLLFQGWELFATSMAKIGAMLFSMVCLSDYTQSAYTGSDMMATRKTHILIIAQYPAW